MNQLTLRYRLLALTLLPSALIAIVLVFYFTLSGVRGLEGDLRAKGLATVRYLAPISEYGIIAGQTDSLHSLVQTTIQEPGVKAAVIVNQKGRTIAVSGRVSLAADVFRSSLRAAGQVTETDQWIAFGAPVFRSVNDADALFEPANGKASTPPQEVIGHVFVEFDKTELARRQSQLMERGFVIILIGLLLLAALAIAMADNLAKPVLRLVKAVRQMSAGNFETRVQTGSSGEVGTLEQGFNEMAAHIEDIHLSMQTRIEEATAQLAYQARHDALTGLLNRREFEHQLERALAATQAGGEAFSVLFIDLDRFKPVNDTCGHLAGDELLRQIAQLFQGRLREEDSLARVGGDEFSILLANCTGKRARQVAEDICNLAAAYRFIWQDKVFAIGASIGLSTVTRDVRKLQDIMAAGDAACYRAKEMGRNQVVEQLPAAPSERRQESGGWRERITRALADQRILIDALPLCALHADTEPLHRVEISAHLSEPGQAFVTYTALIDAAERNDMAPALDCYFIDQAIAALARASKLGKALLCFTPISISSLLQRETAEHIASRLAFQRVDGKGLCLLINESEAGRHALQTLEFCRTVRNLGCAIAIDDFGGGLSSFSHLRSIAPDFVKLSRSLTRDLGGNRASTALLRAVQEISTDLGIETIADGVDNQELLEQLARLNVNFAQGKAVSPSEPIDVWLEGAVFR